MNTFIFISDERLCKITNKQTERLIWFMYGIPYEKAHNQVRMNSCICMWKQHIFTRQNWVNFRYTICQRERSASFFQWKSPHREKQYTALESSETHQQIYEYISRNFIHFLIIFHQVLIFMEQKKERNVCQFRKRYFFFNNIFDELQMAFVLREKRKSLQLTSLFHTVDAQWNIPLNINHIKCS